LKRLVQLGLGLLYCGVLALGIYEMTAKSPSLLGTRLPGWWATDRAEKATRWNPPTGVLPVDKLLHEGEEAVRFYASLTTHRS
jgi:hypothetical protein